MNVRNHTTNVSRRIGRLSCRRIFDRIKVLHNRFVEVTRVAFVKGVDLSPRRNLDIGVGQHKLPKGRIKRESVDTVAGSENQVR